MIQRIQSVYLLLVTILLVVAICMPVGQFIGADGVTAHVFKPLGVALADGGFQSTWGLFGILLLSALVAFSKGLESASFVPCCPKNYLSCALPCALYWMPGGAV